MKSGRPVIHSCFFWHRQSVNFKVMMKISWTSLKISIAGAKLSHLVQKDKIWDHGSMIEQARIIFYLVMKIKSDAEVETLKKCCTMSCFKKIEADIKSKGGWREAVIKNPIIKELVITEANQGKNNKPDVFTALIKGILKEELKNIEQEFSIQCLFVRQGEWWMLDEIRS